MTDDDQIRLALRWSIPNITEDKLLTTTMDWNDSSKVYCSYFHSDIRNTLSHFRLNKTDLYYSMV
jgi:hypothetical protein